MEVFNNWTIEEGRKHEKPNVVSQKTGEALCVSLEIVHLNWEQLRGLLRDSSVGCCVAVCSIKMEQGNHAVAAFRVNFDDSNVVEAKNSWGEVKPILGVTRDNCLAVYVLKPVLHWVKKEDNRIDEGEPEAGYSTFIALLNTVVSSFAYDRFRIDNVKDGDIEYEGELDGTKPHGNGTARWPRMGHHYSGQWGDGYPSGRGKAALPNKASYDGEWEGGMRHGTGVEKCVDGSSYDGQWKEDERHGRGVQKYEDFSLGNSRIPL